MEDILVHGVVFLILGLLLTVLLFFSKRVTRFLQKHVSWFAEQKTDDVVIFVVVVLLTLLTLIPVLVFS